jgi:hypothetical protein
LRLSWSVLWGFPGEQDAWYQQMAGWLPALEHLQPPAGLHRLRYDRFSVYHNQAQQIGLRLLPISAMRFVYPVSEHDLQDLTYFFVEDSDSDSFQWLYGNRRPELLQPGRKAVFRAVDTWKTNFSRELKPILSMSERNGALEVLDSRSVSKQFRIVLKDLDRAVCLACDEAPSSDRLPRILADRFGLHAKEEQISAALDELIGRRVILPIDGRLITLAVQGSIPKLPELEEFPGGYVRSLATTPSQREYLAAAGGN